MARGHFVRGRDAGVVHDARSDRPYFSPLKTINDSLGHSAGDAVLSAFAGRLPQCVRANDTVTRLGGDEFVVLTENLRSREDASALAESVLERMRRGTPIDDEHIHNKQIRCWRFHEI